MRVAVTGATGFVGWHLVHELLRQGYQPLTIVRGSSKTERLQALGVSVCVAELDSVEQLTDAFHGCHSVVHLASAVDFGGDWERFHRVNVIGTANVLVAARNAGVRRVVHCSTIAAVGASRAPVKRDESAKWNLGGLRVPYVTTKWQAEQLALAANDDRLEVVVANPACVIGPDDHSASEFGVMCQRFWRGKLPIHFGGGNNFVDVRDVARGLRFALTKGRPGQRYILGGANRSMGAFFADLTRTAGVVIPRIRLPSALGRVVALAEPLLSKKQRRRAYLSPAQARLVPWFFYFDCGKAQRELGWTARPLRESLADAFTYWQAQRAA